MSPCVSWRRLNSTESKYEIFMASPQTNIEGKKRSAGSRVLQSCNCNAGQSLLLDIVLK